MKDSSFTVRDGEFFCLLGPSGCGKTTTLRMIAGLELPTSGQIFLGGEDVTFKRASQRDIAFVFQLFALYPHMNVRQQHRLPAGVAGHAAREIAAKVDEAARILRITHLLDKPVSGLSSGDRQRVALGRAIVRQPLAFMMDEPLGALDSEFRELMCDELRALHDRLNATTVYVTHDQIEAMAMADTIAIMNHGVIEQLGAPQEVYDRPASVFVADFIGSPAMNFLPFAGGYAAGTRRCDSATRCCRCPRCARTRPERTLLCGVRPEHVRFASGSVAARRGARHRVPRHAARSSPADAQPAHDAARQGGVARCRRSAATRSAWRSTRAQVSLFDAGSRPRAAHRAPRDEVPTLGARAGTAGSRHG